MFSSDRLTYGIDGLEQLTNEKSYRAQTHQTLAPNCTWQRTGGSLIAR